MHKSRLAGFIIDCSTDDLDAAAEFWRKALGARAKYSGAADPGCYVSLDRPSGDIYMEVQKVSHPSRIHLDIETDDITAEVARLEALGARKIADVEDWCVMEAPSGQRFCVVPAASAHFDSQANVWP